MGAQTNTGRATSGDYGTVKQCTSVNSLARDRLQRRPWKTGQQALLHGNKNTIAGHPQEALSLNNGKGEEVTPGCHDARKYVKVTKEQQQKARKRSRHIDKHDDILSLLRLPSLAQGFDCRTLFDQDIQRHEDLQQVWEKSSIYRVHSQARRTHGTVAYHVYSKYQSHADWESKGSWEPDA
eukprot:765968-Hanusia_phi.AAC.4